jgi:hypothetical protein
MFSENFNISENNIVTVLLVQVLQYSLGIKPVLPQVPTKQVVVQGYYYLMSYQAGIGMSPVLLQVAPIRSVL